MRYEICDMQQSWSLVTQVVWDIEQSAMWNETRPPLYSLGFFASGMLQWSCPQSKSSITIHHSHSTMHKCWYRSPIRLHKHSHHEISLNFKSLASLTLAQDHRKVTSLNHWGPCYLDYAGKPSMPSYLKSKHSSQPDIPTVRQTWSCVRVMRPRKNTSPSSSQTFAHDTHKREREK